LRLGLEDVEDAAVHAGGWGGVAEGVENEVDVVVWTMVWGHR
jgi:hypothetical protein